MKFQFSPLILPEPPQFQPNNLTELARNLGSSGSFTSLEKLKNFPIERSRNIDQILAAIEHGQANQVSQLEWVYLIQFKAQWDTEHPDQSIATSKAIWEVATYNSWLSRLLLWRLVLYHSTQVEKALAPTLAESFPIFVSRTKNSKPLPIQIGELVIQWQPGDHLARIACEHLLTPKDLLKRAELPQWIPAVRKALDYIPRQFANLHPPNTQQVDWLLRCLDQMTIQQRISAADRLLTQVTTKVGGSFPKLVAWLRRYYGTGELSKQAQKTLREWIGAVNYEDFQRLVAFLLQKEWLHPQSRESRQLNSRKEFWANYSNSFERIRILLPQASWNALNHQLNELDNEDIKILDEDGSDPTEVCIFDFGNWFVVEFFRGRGSETRLFRRTTQIEQLLFDSAKISLKRIRRLGGEVHDHVFCWQGSCEEWLRSRENGILPNESTQYFQGLPKAFSIYDPKTGLPKPSWNDQQQREEQLISWKRVIAKLEREASEYRHD